MDVGQQALGVRLVGQVLRGEARIAGRDGRFSAGFHLPTMTAGTTEMRGLVGAGAHMASQIRVGRKP